MYVREMTVCYRRRRIPGTPLPQGPLTLPAAAAATFMTLPGHEAVEVRMIVIVSVDVTEPGFVEALAASGSNPTSVTHVVSSEVMSNLESVSYVESVIVSAL